MTSDPAGWLGSGLFEQYSPTRPLLSSGAVRGGCATGSFPYLRMPAGAVRIHLTQGGQATVSCSAQDMGMGTSTVQSQHAADRLGLPLEAITFEMGDSDLPPAPIAGNCIQVG